MFLLQGHAFFVSLYVFKFQATASGFQSQQSEKATKNQSLNKICCILRVDQ
jgi:hypothetical protein